MHALTTLLTLGLGATVFAETIDIDVGEKGLLKFEPSEITAKSGDKLVFHFYSPSAPHDVTQGSFDSPGPCIPSAPNAFYSGMMEGDDDGHKTFTVNVNSSDPIYFYCSIARHCQAGMVGVVNGPSGKGYDEYRNAARNVVSGNRPLEGPVGGVVGTDSESDDDKTSSSSGTASVTSTETQTTGSTAGTTTTTHSTSTTGSVAPSATSSGTISGTETAAGAATTTPSGAGKNGKTPVLLGLAVVLGGLVALMA